MPSWWLQRFPDPSSWPQEGHAGGVADIQAQDPRTEMGVQPGLSPHTQSPEASTQGTGLQASPPQALPPPVENRPGEGRLEGWNEIIHDLTGCSE